MKLKMLGKVKIFLQRLNRFDPVTAISNRLFRGSPLVTAIIVGIVNVCGWWLVGNLTILLYPSGKFTGPTDLSELSWGLFIWGVFVPVVWWYYLSLPKLCKKMVSSLCNEGVVESNSFEKTITLKLNSPSSLLSFFIALVILSIYFSVSMPAEIAAGRVIFWFMTPWGKVIEALYIGVAIYVSANYVLKTLTLILAMRKYFYTKGVKTVHVFHADQCGGFESVGFLATRIASLAVFAGIWAVGYSMLPFMAGGRIIFSATAVMQYLFYAIMVSLLLVSLLWPVSRAMKHYKYEMIMKVARKLQRELNLLVENEEEQEPLDIAANTFKDQEDYQKLYQFYNQLKSTPEWPIRALNLKRFAGFALIPALVGLVSLASDLFTLVGIIKFK